MGKELSIAIGDFDHVRPLRSGDVSIKGIDPVFLDLKPEPLFRQVTQFQQFDVAEMSLSTFVLWTSRGDCPYLGLPVFPSRMFRHSALYIRENSDISEPTDLQGKDVGIVPEYQSTSATTVRGILHEEYGIAPESVDWYTEQKERMEIDLPDDLHVETIDQSENIEVLLEDGVLDALISTKVPQSFGNGITRLFSDYKQAEKEYFEKTQLFPIMHLLVIHRDTYEESPWVARALYDALETARQQAMEKLYDTDSTHVMLPWLADHVEETRTTLGDDYWSYGYESNKPELEAITRFSSEQHLSERKVEPHELIADPLTDT